MHNDRAHLPADTVGRGQEGDGHMGSWHSHLGRLPQRGLPGMRQARPEGEGDRRAHAGRRAPGRRRHPPPGRHGAQEGALEDVRPLQGQRRLSGHRDGRPQQGRPGDRGDRTQARADRDAYGGDRPGCRIPVRCPRRDEDIGHLQRQLLRRASAPQQLPQHRLRHAAVRPALRFQEGRIQRRPEAPGGRDGDIEGRGHHRRGRSRGRAPVAPVGEARGRGRPGDTHRVQPRRYDKPRDHRREDIWQAGDRLCRLQMATSSAWAGTSPPRRPS